MENYLNYLILDIETCPINMGQYETLDEEERKKLLNPIDSRIIAIGVRHNHEDTILLDENEKALLELFWKRWNELRKVGTQIVGFNISVFDLPFLVVRSFVNNVKIVPFTLKYIVDLREKMHAYRPGHSRGTLKEFANLMGMPDIGMDGSHMAALCKAKEYSKIKHYLTNDLLITDNMYKRMKDLSILDVQKW